MLRVADASLGDYYNEKEFKKLSKEQRAEYCAELARQDSMYKDELRTLRDDLDQSRARSQSLRAEGDSLFALGSALEAQATRTERVTASQKGRRPEAGHERHVVRRGESLWAISATSAVYGSGARWRRIYEANPGTIRDPDLIYPGQELSIPR